MKQIFKIKINAIKLLSTFFITIFATALMTGCAVNQSVNSQEDIQVWVWENASTYLPIRMELSDNNFTLVSYDAMVMDGSWLDTSPYAPDVPWRTRNVNEELEHVYTPEELGLHTTVGRGGIKSGVIGGAYRITVTGQYELNGNEMTLFYQNGDASTFAVEMYEDTLTFRNFTFKRAQ